MDRLPVPPDHRVNGDPSQLPAGKLAHDRLAVDLGPPGIGLAVVHYEVGVVQPPGRAELYGFAVQLPSVGDARAAQRAVANQDRIPGDGVVDDFVPADIPVSLPCSRWPTPARCPGSSDPLRKRKRILDYLEMGCRL